MHKQGYPIDLVGVRESWSPRHEWQRIIFDHRCPRFAHGNRAPALLGQRKQWHRGDDCSGI